MKLLFASNNPKKLAEIQQALPEGISVISLRDINFEGEIPETTGTIEGNARQKARFLYERYKINTFADDTGLEVEALNNRPGVDSAFYSGSRDSAANIRKVLTELGDNPNRKARFRTVIALIMDGEEHVFNGTVEGTILEQPQGQSGFGYDPIFCRQGETRSFGQMTLAEKNKDNHRIKALEQLINFLKGQKQF